MNGLKKSKHSNSSVTNIPASVMLAPQVSRAKLRSTARADRILAQACSPERILVVLELAVCDRALNQLAVLTGLGDEPLRAEVRRLQALGLICGYVRDGARLYQLSPIGRDFAEFLAKFLKANDIALSPSAGASNQSKKPPEKPSRESQLDLENRVGRYVDDPATWLRTSNSQFGNRRPVDLIGTEEEAMVFRVLKAADQGFFA